MKKLSRKRKRLLIISGGVLLLLVLVILTVRGVHHLTSPRVDTEQGIQYIKAGRVRGYCDNRAEDRAA